MGGVVADVRGGGAGGVVQVLVAARVAGLAGDQHWKVLIRVEKLRKRICVLRNLAPKG